MLDDLPVPALVSDSTGVILYANEGLRALNGQWSNGRSDVRFADVVHPDDRSAWTAACHAEHATTYDLRVRTDGGYRWYRLQSRPRPIGDSLAHIVSTLHDIDVLKRVERRADDIEAITRALSTATGLQGVIDALPSIAAVLDASRVDLMLLRDEGRELYLVGSTDSSVSAPRRVLPLPCSVPAADALRTKEVLVLDARTLEERYPHLPDGFDRRPRQLVALPLLAEDRALGVLTLELHEALEASASDRVFLETLVGTVARTVDRVRHLQRERAVHARLEAILDASPTLMWTSRTSEDVLHFNQTWRTYTGFPATLPRHEWEQTVHPDDVALIRRIRADGRSAGRSYALDVRFRRSDGTYRWHHVTVQPFGDEEWLGVATDVHDRRESEAKLHLTLEAGGLGVWTYDVTTRLITRTPEVMRLLGFADAVGPVGAFTARVHEEDRGRVVAALDDAVRPGGLDHLKLEHRFLRPDGALIWLEQLLRVERDEQGHVLRVLGVTADVTTRKHHEQRLSLLAEAGETLAQNLDVHETLERLSALAVPRLADWCVVYLPQLDGVLAPIAVQHRDPGKVEVARRYIDAFPARGRRGGYRPVFS